MRAVFYAETYKVFQVHVSARSIPASRNRPATRARVPFLTADMSICIANASVPTSRGIASRAGLSRRGRHTNATRGAASRVFRVFRAESTSENLCDAAHLSRRAALGVSLSALSALASPSLPLALADASATATFGAVPNERWSAIDATTSVPSSWTTRPGQRVKQSKFMLYTDTYGPNYRYTTALPKFVDGDGAVAANAIQLAVQSRGGQDSIADLGPIGGIDAAKAFGIEAEDVALAETVTSSKRVDGSKQAYYEWELLCPTGSHILISACISGGGLYVFSAEATETQWRKNADALRAAQKSFAVPVVAESTLDISDRIYNNANDGGFK